jgi:hypothetical protein
MSTHPRQTNRLADLEPAPPHGGKPEPQAPLRTLRSGYTPRLRGPEERPEYLRIRDARPRPRAPENAMLVLVPSAFGGLRCFERNKPGPLRAGPTVVDPDDLEQRVQRGHHHTVVLCGARYRSPVADAVCDHAELYLVPLQWLRDVPKDAPDEMAAVAAKLISALRRHPVRRRPRRNALDRLF